MPGTDRLEAKIQNEEQPRRDTHSKSRLLGLVALLVMLFVLPGLVALPAAHTWFSSVGVIDTKPQFLEMSLVNPGGATAFVSANRADSVRFQIVNRFRSEQVIAWQVKLVPDSGGSRTLQGRSIRLGPGRQRFATFSGRVPCESRSRVILTAWTAEGSRAEVAFHVFAYRSHGTLICTSNPDVEQS